MKTGWRGKIWALCTVVLLSAMYGCERPSEFVPPPPPEVTVQQPQTRDIVDHANFTGNTQATATVELRARINGYLQQIAFEDGASVKQGDLLFVIEPAPFQAALEARSADLQRAKAALQLAQVELKRNELLEQKKIASQQDVDQRRADLSTTRANVAVAQAAVSNAKLDLDYTEIRAPVTGRIGRHLVDVGNLVQSQQTLLATIESIDPIYAYFYVSESDLLRFRQMIRDNELPDPEEKPPLMRLGLANEKGFPHEGYVDFRDLGVNPDTGTILVRALFPNPRQILLPGLFVRLRAPVGEPKPRLMIDERAVAADQRGKYVLVVNDENKVEYRSVELGLAEKGMREIIDGVLPQDWVVVNGLQRARPGATVTPQRAAPAAADRSAQVPASLLTPDRRSSPATTSEPTPRGASPADAPSTSTRRDGTLPPRH
jgi:RND family efflux transporter MFP subunit